MPNTTKHGHTPDMSGIKEGPQTKFCNAASYVKEPGNSYGKPRSGLQPDKARRQSYNASVTSKSQVGVK